MVFVRQRDAGGGVLVCGGGGKDGVEDEGVGFAEFRDGVGPEVMDVGLS